jgi:hypothetical protein
MNAVHEPPEMKPARVVMVTHGSCLCDLRADNARIYINNRVSSPRITDYGVTNVTHVNRFHPFALTKVGPRSVRETFWSSVVRSAGNPEIVHYRNYRLNRQE